MPETFAVELLPTLPTPLRMMILAFIVASFCFD
jgi:hypothetical protein